MLNTGALNLLRLFHGLISDTIVILLKNENIQLNPGTLTAIINE